MLIEKQDSSGVVQNNFTDSYLSKVISALALDLHLSVTSSTINDFIYVRVSVHADEEVGGMQLPFAITACLQSAFTAANCGTCAYPFLTIAAGNMLRTVGTPEQQQRYLLPMLAGEVFGTMNLSETQAGSSLGDITTKAVKQDDGSYVITGQKMWISGGDHELSDNIFHMVLAKIHPKDQANGSATAGVKGISLFVVPKYRLPHQNGANCAVGKRNGVALAGLNHKMGTTSSIIDCVL